MPAPSAERLATLLGLLVVMLATLPRYLTGGHETRLSLMLMACVAVMVVVLWQWRQLAQFSRQRIPALLGRLTLCLLLGLGAMTGWHAMNGGLSGWQVPLSHGTTAGLLIYVLGVWWQREEAES